MKQISISDVGKNEEQTVKKNLSALEVDLRELYLDFRKVYFDYKVPPLDEVTIEWSYKLTAAAGNCYVDKKIIRLSTHYHRKFPEEVSATLLHEMIHLLVRGHGVEFKKWIEYINNKGGEVSRYSKERATKKGEHRWIYLCIDCGREHPRQRRIKIKTVKGTRVCGKCRGNLKEIKV